MSLINSRCASLDLIKLKWYKNTRSILELETKFQSSSPSWLLNYSLKEVARRMDYCYYYWMLSHFNLPRDIIHYLFPTLVYLQLCDVYPLLLNF